LLQLTTLGGMIASGAVARGQPTPTVGGMRLILAGAVHPFTGPDLPSDEAHTTGLSLTGHAGIERRYGFGKLATALTMTTAEALLISRWDRTGCLDGLLPNIAAGRARRASFTFT